MATTDSNGVVFYEDTDPVSPLHTLLNLGQQGTANALQALADRRTSVAVDYTPPGNVDANPQSTSWVTWATLGSLTVPTWANTAVVTLGINGAFLITSAIANVYTRLTIGNAAGDGARLRHPQDVTEMRLTHVHNFEIANLQPGSQSVTLQASRRAGDGAYRLDVHARVSCSIVWQP